MLPAITVAVVIAISSPVQATSQTGAEQESLALLRRGFELRKAGRIDEALKVIRRAHEIAPTPRAAAQLGVAEQEAGHWLEAERYLSKALAAASDPHVSRHRAAYERALEVVRGRLGSLTLIGGVAGAEVYINRARAGVLPLREPLRLVAGSSLVEVKAAGYLPFSRFVQIAPGGRAREIIELLPEPASAGRPNRTDGPAVDGQERRKMALRIAAWATLAGGAALVGGGIASVIIGKRAESRYASDACAPDRSVKCAGDLATIRTAQRAVPATFATGGALIGTSVVLFVLPKLTPKPKTRARLICGPDTAVSGVSCRGQF